jgi:hypothetical protein
MDNFMQSQVNQAGASLGGTEELREARRLVLSGATIPTPAVRVLDGNEFVDLQRQIREVAERRASALIKVSAPHGTVEERLFRVLRGASLSLTRTAFDDSTAMRAVRLEIARATSEQRPLVLAMPLGGAKAPNALKTDNVILPDAGEWAAAALLAAMVRAMRWFHSPGAHLLLVPDAGLHSDDLRFPYSDTALHVAQLRDDLARLGFGDEVLVADTTAALSPRWREVIEAGARAAIARLRTSVDYREDFTSQVRSLVSSMNTRLQMWSAEHTVLVYSAVAGLVDGLDADIRAHAAELYAAAERATPFYVATNKAIRDLRLIDSAVLREFGRPQHVRLTVHVKPGEPRPALLLPSHLGGSVEHLPMHGVGVIGAGHAGRLVVRVAFALGAQMRGHEMLTDSKGRFLAYAERGQEQEVAVRLAA